MLFQDTIDMENQELLGNNFITQALKTFLILLTL